MHHLHFTIRRGRVHVQCGCGWNGGKHRTSDAALEEWRGHVAVQMERQRRLAQEQRA